MLEYLKKEVICKEKIEPRLETRDATLLLELEIPESA
ncbi:MAG: hypothetical protein UU27_C0007G0022 [Parcubacteria group bacterium GW2011_GWD1_40_9]|nr:MAG: hypothetical protein UU27_C0007G0022 [Parcubacteria group bacterium GW2011_GWD1_40_9]